MNSILVSTIICPHCHVELEVHRETCPYCQKPLRDPVANATTRGTDEEQQRVLDRPWVIAVLLLHVGFLGIPWYWKTRYSLGTRVTICLLSVAYTIFAVSAILGIGLFVYRQFMGAM